MSRGLVFSDFHLFSPRSDGERLLAKWAPRMNQAEVVVLNGDTFDFRWSTRSGHAASVREAEIWLRGWVERLRGRDLHYVLGNHDCLAGFRERLERLSREATNFHVHEYHLTLGTQLFLHGDCANRHMSVANLAAFRDSWSKDRQRGAMGRWLYGLADASGIGPWVHRRYFDLPGTLSRISAYLDEALPGWDERVRDCYFGHTHLPFEAVTHRQVRFHNTGSAIRGMGFVPLEFPLGEVPACVAR